jgi:D-glycero-alpha-D-manno-heptose-7-phosphate kinase
MVITKTPFRMSFFGGGTDLREFYSQYGGAVLSSTFDKYCYVTVRHLPEFFSYKNEIVYSKIERPNSVAEIQHPLIRNCMQYVGEHNIRLTYDADLPARTGLGTSSSFAVGMLNAFHALQNKIVDKRMLADEAIYAERVLCAEAGGIQDQIAASFGGLNYIEMNADNYYVHPVIVSPERKQMLNDSLMLFFTGFSHHSWEVQTEVKSNIKEKISNLQEMKSLVYEALKLLSSNGSLQEFGRLMNLSWQLKRRLSTSISSDAIDEMYAKAMNAGAVGGKLLGSGGGGFLLFYVDPDKRAFVRKAMNDLLYIPFRFETGGSRIVYFNNEDMNF